MGCTWGVKCPSLNALAHPSLACLTPSICLVKKCSCPFSPAACADARAPNVHKWQPHWPPPKLFTDVLLRLNSASSLLLWHLLGNSAKLSGLTDWNTELKMRREDPSFSHCTLPSSCHSSDWFCCNYPNRSVYYLLCDRFHERLEEFLLWRPRERDYVPWSTVLLGRTNKQKQNQRKVFSCIKGELG